MRIHTDLTMAQMRDLPRPSGVGMYRLTEHGSRSRTRGFDMILEGTSAYGGQFGNQDYSAGTWDEWGDVLGELFAADPCARITGIYEGAEDYHWATGDRFHPDADEPHNLCKRHKWELVGPWRRHAIEWEHQCTRKDCTAVKRYHRWRIGDQNPGGNALLIAALPELPTYPRVNDAGVTVWACCESSIGPTCAHRREIVEVGPVEGPLVIGATPYTGAAYLGEADAPGMYDSKGAYAADLKRNPVDILDRIDDLIGD